MYNFAGITFVFQLELHDFRMNVSLNFFIVLNANLKEENANQELKKYTHIYRKTVDFDRGEDD